MATVAQHSTDVQTVAFDHMLTQEPCFEQALAYHALALLHAAPSHLDRIAAAAAVCQVGRIQVRCGTGLVHVRREALRAYVCGSEGCECGVYNGSEGWPCVHRYAVVLWKLATQHTYEIVMTHPRKQFEVALYDGPRLLAVLQAVSEADWATMERILDQAMIG